MKDLELSSSLLDIQFWQDRQEVDDEKTPSGTGGLNSYS